MQALYINGKPMGNVIRYRQNRDARRWTFDMFGGYNISIDFDSIKLFSSGAKLEIILYYC